MIFERLVKHTAELPHDHVAGKPQLAQDLAGRTHHVGEILRRDYDQRDRQYYYDFDYAQIWRSGVRYFRRAADAAAAIQNSMIVNAGRGVKP